jgi:hypothetical protein
MSQSLRGEPRCPQPRRAICNSLPQCIPACARFVCRDQCKHTVARSSMQVPTNHQPGNPRGVRIYVNLPCGGHAQVHPSAYLLLLCSAIHSLDRSMQHRCIDNIINCAGRVDFAACAHPSCHHVHRHQLSIHLQKHTNKQINKHIKQLPRARRCRYIYPSICAGSSEALLP